MLLRLRHDNGFITSISTVIVLRSEVEWLVIVIFKYGQLRLYKGRLMHVMSITIHVTEITGKILSDHNTILFYRLHGDIVHIVIVTVIDIDTVIVLSQ